MKAVIKNLSKKLLRDETNKTQIQMFRYLFVGGAAFIIDFISLFILTDFFGIYYLISAPHLQERPHAQTRIYAGGHASLGHLHR